MRALEQLGPVLGAPVAAAIEAKAGFDIAAIMATTMFGLAGGGGGGGGAITGGGGSGGDGGTGGGGAETPSITTQQLELSASVVGPGEFGSTTSVIELRAGAGDTIGELLVEVINKAIKDGRIPRVG